MGRGEDDELVRSAASLVVPIVSHEYRQPANIAMNNFCAFDVASAIVFSPRIT